MLTFSELYGTIGLEKILRAIGFEELFFKTKFEKSHHENHHLFSQSSRSHRLAVLAKYGTSTN
jgi:hypothetical protein